ncbi:hypothetical protein ANCCAN_28895 [Ancylostoma caninum]|uniref:Uncharacterized protein n=1 Tax=Ancylostoma caninum TaxID=29170 RepID=A0A368EZZ8_ANCCA|nr:hypothetical protein ANCCAN_28895 [Ancylostoma caninum]
MFPVLGRVTGCLNQKDYDDGLYLQCTHACIGGFHRGFDDARQEDQVRCHRTDRDEETPASEHHIRHSTQRTVSWNLRQWRSWWSRCPHQTNLVMNIDSFEQLTMRIGRL